jgi:hypothetical protein
MVRSCKKGKGKAPPKPPSSNRDDEGVFERQHSKSLRLADSSPPPNSVLTKDNSNAAMVAQGDVEEKNSKESNNDSISLNMTDVQNKDLFTIDNRGNTTRAFPSQSLPDNQETFMKRIEDGHKVSRLLLPQVNTEIIMQDRYDAVKATIGKFKKNVPTKSRTPYDTESESKVSHQSKPPKKKTPSHELQINSDLEQFIEALPHLEPIHYAFCLSPSVAYVHACLVLHPRGQCSILLLRKKIIVETCFILPMAMVSYNTLK